MQKCFFTVSICLAVLLSIYSSSKAEFILNEHPITADTSINVLWTDNVAVSVDVNTITSTAVNGWGNSGAASTQVITGDGGVTFTASETNTYRMCGLSYTDTNADYTEISYAVYLATHNRYYVFENGIQKAAFTNYASGDVFSIERTGTAVAYKRNGTVFYTSTVACSGDLIVDTSFYNLGATIDNAVMTGIGNEPPVTKDMNLKVGIGQCLALTLDAYDPDGDTLVYAVGTPTNGVLSGIAPNLTYTPNAGYTGADSFTYQVSDDEFDSGTSTVTIQPAAGGPVIWTNEVGVNVDGLTITSTSDKGWRNSGAASAQVITGDGGVTFTASETNTHRMCGLSYTDTSADYTEISYAVYLATNNRYYVFANGIQKAAFTNYASGDVFSIERTGTAVAYKRNGTVFYTSTVACSGDLIVDTSFYTPGATIEKALIIGADGGYATEVLGELCATESINKINLFWNVLTDPAYIDHYAVYAGETFFESVEGMTPVLTTAQKSAEVTELIGGTPYYFAVTVIDVNNSEEKTVIPISATPKANTPVGGIISQDTTWTIDESPYLVTEDIYVRPLQPGSADIVTLTINSGVKVLFAPGTKLMVGQRIFKDGYYFINYGRLIAQGTKQPIEFTSNAINPHKGDWCGIQIEYSQTDFPSIMENCIIEYGGQDDVGNIVCNNSNFSIKKCKVQNSGANGIYLSGAITPIIGDYENGNLITLNNGYGIYSSDEKPYPQIIGNAISENSMHPIRISPRMNVAANTYGGNGSESIEVIGGSISENTVWDSGIPYLVKSDVTVSYKKQDGFTSILVIKPGVEIRFEPETGLYIGKDNGYGGLIAIGTADHPILFTSAATSKAPGDWRGIHFRRYTNTEIYHEDSKSSTAMDHCIVEYGGHDDHTNIFCEYATLPISNTISRYSMIGIQLTNSSSKITNCVITGNNETGINLSGTSHPIIDGTTISANGNYAIYSNGECSDSIIKNNQIINNGSAIRIDSEAEVVSNSITGNSANQIELFGEYIGHDTTWHNNGVPVVVQNKITVRNDSCNMPAAILTIEPGVAVRFKPDTGLYIGISCYYGAICAKGNSEQPIVFTKENPLTATENWKGINFSAPTDFAQTVLEHCIIEYGNSDFNSNVHFDSASATVKNCTIQNSANGISLKGHSKPIISRNIVRNNDAYGIYAITNEPWPAIAENTIENNGGYPIRIGSMHTVRGNTGTGNGINGIEIVNAKIQGKTVWYKNDFPYIVKEDQYVSNANTADPGELKIEAGVEIRFEAGTGLFVHENGVLNAQGNRNAKILFTSNSASPQPGDWKGLRISRAAVNAVIDNCIVQYGGHTYNSNIYCDAISPQISNSLISNSSYAGIHLQYTCAPTILNNTITHNPYGIYIANKSTPVILGNSFIENEIFAVFNNSTTVVSALNNWWGDATGPYDISDDTATGGLYNPNGKGDEVSDYVDYGVQWYADIDNDGLPDGWELAHFGNLDQGPEDDADADGLTNLQEYEAGTAPFMVYPPSITVTATPDHISAGDQIILQWDSSLAEICTIEPAIGGGTIAQDGSLTLNPDTTTIYTITATGPGGSAIASAKVVVDEAIQNTSNVPPDVDLGLGDESLNTGGLVGRLIRILNGNMLDYRSDLEIPSPNQIGFAFDCYYNSQSETDGILGRGWRHSYDLVLNPAFSIDNQTYIRIVDQTGRAHYFIEGRPGIYSGAFNDPTYVKLESNNYNWYLLDGTRYSFSENGRLVWMEDIAQNRVTLQYASDGKLEQITDEASSRTLTLNYNDDRLESISGPVTTAIPSGIWVTYGYNSDLDLDSVTYADDSGYDYVYDNRNIIEKRNKAGHLIGSYDFDNQDRCILYVDKSSNGVELNYVDVDRIIVTDTYNIERTYLLATVSGRKRLHEIQGAANAPYSDINIEKYTYDEHMNLVEVQYPNGNIDRFENFDLRGNPGKIILASGSVDEQVIEYTYHPSLNVPLSRTQVSVLGGGNKVTIWDFDIEDNNHPNENPGLQVNRVIEQGFTKGDLGTIPFLYKTHYTYNAQGRLLSINGPKAGNEDTVLFSYDPSGNLSTIVKPLIGTTTFSGYDAAGYFETITDVNNQTQTFVYDGRGRITQTSHFGDGRVSSIVYNIAGLVERKTDADNISRSYSYYNQTGLLDTIFDAEGNYIIHDYDDHGNLIDKTYFNDNSELTNRRQWNFQHPVYPGKLWRAIKKNESYTEYNYDTNGNISSVTDPNGNTTYYTYDNLNRLKTISQPGNSDTVYTYDIHGNLATVTDAENHTTTYAYDDLGRIIQISSPDSGIVNYFYNNDGNLYRKTDSNENVTEFVYDALNRLVEVNYPNLADQNVTYTYDDGLNGMGRRTGVNDPSGQIVFSYDARGRLTNKSNTIDGYTFNLSRSFTPGGRLSTITYPSGRTVEKSYDPNGRTQSLTTTYDGTTKSLIQNATYQSFGMVKSFQLIGTISGSVNIEPGDCNCVGTSNEGGLTEKHRLFDANGNLEAIYAPNLKWHNRDYVYDNHNRLSGAEGAFGDYQYQYDKVGNRNRLDKSETFLIDGNEIIPQTTTETYEYYPGTNRLAEIISTSPSTPLTYDANGNTIRKGFNRYVYDQNNRLIRFEKSGTIFGEYKYNALGQRVYKKAETGRYFVYDFDSNIIAEADENGTLVTEYIYNGTSILAKIIVDSGNIYYFQNDALGTPLIMIDENGLKVWEAIYKPFGEADVQPGAVVKNNFRFRGQYYDEESGLHYNYFRYYDPQIGRYLRVDPIGQLGGINTYVYAFNNPINEIDPLGLWSFSVEAYIPQWGGTGYGFVIGQDPGKKGFWFSLRAGKGIGAGFLFDPFGTSPAYNSPCDSPDIAVGAYADISLAAAYLYGTLNSNVGVALSEKSHGPYGKILSPSYGVTSTFSLKASAAIGGEATFYFK